MGFKFRRQAVIEPYIVDFVYLDAKLIIEADGGHHAEQITYLPTEQFGWKPWDIALCVSGTTKY
ncbi:hypothetical protein MNBD_GAMMA24-2558 [hydrothermal vent metagenome]|uniref:DUF559 domain-containing protein n=1 Tax=hydrothermal vent metagenome TaxID=652676 RepID=A0A3B1C8H2_9ZZZZ